MRQVSSSLCLPISELILILFGSKLESIPGMAAFETETWQALQDSLELINNILERLSSSWK